MYRNISDAIANSRVVGAGGQREECVLHHPERGTSGRTEIASKDNGAGCVFSFDMKGSHEQGKKFIEMLKIFRTSPTSAIAAASSFTPPAPRISA